MLTLITEQDNNSPTGQSASSGTSEFEVVSEPMVSSTEMVNATDAMTTSAYSTARWVITYVW